jgi:hypothetical protein
MKPFIGKKWGEINKILLIGESHSLGGLTDEKIIANWYTTKNEKFPCDQQCYTTTEKLINDGLESGNFHKNRIYGEINCVIKSVGNELDLNYFSL